MKKSRKKRKIKTKNIELHLSAGLQLINISSTTSSAGDPFFVPDPPYCVVVKTLAAARHRLITGANRTFVLTAQTDVVR